MLCCVLLSFDMHYNTKRETTTTLDFLAHLLLNVVMNDFGNRAFNYVYYTPNRYMHVCMKCELDFYQFSVYTKT